MAWEHAHTEWLRAQGGGDIDQADRWHAEMGHHEESAGDADRRLRDRAATAATVLAGEIHVWVPRGATTPLQAGATSTRERTQE